MSYKARLDSEACVDSYSEVEPLPVDALVGIRNCIEITSVDSSEVVELASQSVSGHK